MNVRTEISMGMMTDGCTSLSWKTAQRCYLAQNWDWEVHQRENLIAIYIKQDPKPSTSQITEAGIIGKIGLNSCGVGVCLNAIRVKGVDYACLPFHLGSRVALNSTSREEAVTTLEKSCLASAAHVLIADASGGTSMEFSALDLAKFEMRDGKVAHTNHFLVKHADGVADATFMADSKERMARVSKLMADKSAEKGFQERELGSVIEGILKDEVGLPGAICRAASEQSPAATLFSIVMNLGIKEAVVKVGRPTESKSTLRLVLYQK